VFQISFSLSSSNQPIRIASTQVFLWNGVNEATIKGARGKKQIGPTESFFRSRSSRSIQRRTAFVVEPFFSEDPPCLLTMCSDFLNKFENCVNFFSTWASYSSATGNDLSRMKTSVKNLRTMLFLKFKLNSCSLEKNQNLFLSLLGSELENLKQILKMWRFGRFWNHHPKPGVTKTPGFLRRRKPSAAWMSLPKMMREAGRLDWGARDRGTREEESPIVEGNESSRKTSNHKLPNSWILKPNS